MARGAVALGDLNRAHAAAREITDAGLRVEVLAELSGQAGPVQAQAFLAEALTISHWEASVTALVQVNPAAVIAIEYLTETPTQDRLR